MTFPPTGESARETNEAAGIQSNMLEARVAFYKYRLNGSVQFRDALSESLDTAERSIQHLKDITDDVKVEEEASKFLDGISEYKSGFKKYAELKVEHAGLIDNSLDVAGPAISKNLQKVTSVLIDENNHYAATASARLQNSVSEMRLMTAKYLRTENEFHVVLAQKIA